MEVRQVNRPILDCGYIGPSLEFSGVVYVLPYLTITRWPGGGGYVGVGWIFWYANLEWRSEKAR